MATSPNFSWPEPDNTDLVKNGALAIRTAVNAIDSSLAELKGGTTGQVLSKTSGTDMDFTWVAQDDSNAIQNAIVDAKGDIIVATAADTPARLAVGTNGQVLKANSATATGLEWASDSAGMTNPMTTTGDTIYSSSGSTPARLGIGSTGQVLTVAGGVPSWATPAGGSTLVGCSITATGTQSISNATFTALTFDTEVFDTDGFHSNATNNTRITIPSGKAGKYSISSMWQPSSASATGRRLLKIYINGTVSNVYFTETAPTSGTYPLVLFVGVLDLAVGDYIETYAYQSSGGSDSIDKAVSFFNAIYLGA
jgi:hypothetical protein